MTNPKPPLIARLEGTAFWRVKTRLQFTGWLQYMPNAVAALLLLLLAAVGRATGVLMALLFWLPLLLGGLLLANLLFDLLTVKMGLRPREPLPRRRDDLDAFDLMLTRRSCRSFQARRLTPEHHAELMATVRAESEPGRRLGERPIRFEYVAAPLTVWPVVGAREFLVAIAPAEYDRRAVIDVGRCLQKVVLHATRMGLGTCWIGPGANHESVQGHLGERFDAARDHIICVCAVGYRSRFMPLMIRGMGSGMSRRRLPLDELFFGDPSFDAPLDRKAAPFARFERCYEACRWAPSSFNAQPTRCVGTVAQRDGEDRAEGEAARFDFYASTDSRYYAPVALGIWLANWEVGCTALGIDGRFTELPPEQRGAQGSPELPHYDVSWEG